MGYKAGVLNKKERDYLIPLELRTPIIYSLPKEHKSLDKPPGFPIVNGIDSVVKFFGKYVDFFLEQVLKQVLRLPNIF